MNHRILIVLMSLIFSACDRRPPLSQDSAEVVVFVVDASGSVDRPTSRCVEIVERVAVLLKSHDANELHVLALALGDADHVEPEVVVPWIVLVPEVEDPLNPKPDDFDRKRIAFLDAIETSCTSSLTTAKRISPIRLAIRRGASALSARCEELGRAGTTCRTQFLFVGSDLRESVDDCVVQHLNARIRKAKKIPSCELAPIELPKTAQVVVCGTAENRESSTIAEASAIEQVWQELIPNVDVEPFCPSPNTKQVRQ